MLSLPYRSYLNGVCLSATATQGVKHRNRWTLTLVILHPETHWPTMITNLKLGHRDPLELAERALPTCSFSLMSNNCHTLTMNNRVSEQFANGTSAHDRSSRCMTTNKLRRHTSCEQQVAGTLKHSAAMACSIHPEPALMTAEQHAHQPLAR